MHVDIIIHVGAYAIVGRTIFGGGSRRARRTETIQDIYYSIECECVYTVGCLRYVQFCAAGCNKRVKSIHWKGSPATDASSHCQCLSKLRYFGLPSHDMHMPILKGTLSLPVMVGVPEADASWCGADCIFPLRQIHTRTRTLRNAGARIRLMHIEQARSM